MTAEEVKQLISAVDVDHNGMINYEEFLTTMIDWSLVEQHDSNHFHELVDELFDVSGPMFQFLSDLLLF